MSTDGHRSGFLGLPPEYRDPATARYEVLPVPFEATVSYGGGTAAGPAAIVAASAYVELFDGHGEPATAGILTAAPVALAGLLGEAAVAAIAAATAPILAAGRLPVILGGEHTATLGPVRALRDAGHTFGVVQFDAHADLRDTYEGTPWSHACVMRRIAEQGLPLAQIGVRSLSAPEAEYRRTAGVHHVDAAAIAVGGLPEPLLPADFPEAVYITFDVDALDPSICPATGTPEPGGLDWYTALAALERTMAGRRVLGFDVVELAPAPGLHAADFTVAKLTYAVIGMIERLRAERRTAND